MDNQKKLPAKGFLKWCDKGWLVVIYGTGILMLLLTLVFWKHWNIPRRLLAVLTILLPLHVFEENTYPGGFHYLLNTVRNSKAPNAGPMNKLTDMISNFGGELFFLILFMTGGTIGTSLLVAFFGIGEAVIHTIFGIITWRKLKDKGLHTIYDPGLATAYLTLVPLSIVAIFWLRTQTITGADTLVGAMLVICTIALLILLPIKIFGRYQKEYFFESSGFYSKLKN